MPDPVLPPTIQLPDDPVNNPNVEPAPVWTWTGLWVFLLFILERLTEDLSAWQDRPKWVPYVLLALPVAIRWVRAKASGIPTVFRRLKP